MHITDGQHWNQIDYILCSQRSRSSIQSAKTRPGVDCGSGHELLIAKFRLKLKKVGKTTRPSTYDLNQIHLIILPWLSSGSDKQIQGLDMIDTAPEELQTEVCDTVQEIGIKTISKKKKCKKAKWLSEDALWIAEKRREVKGKGEKERYTHLNCRAPKHSKER